MFGAVLAAGDTPPGMAADVAREFSPRIEVWSDTEVVLDLSGLTRLFGDARTIAEELRRTAADRGVRVRVAIAGTRTAARLLVRHRAGLTIVDPGAEAAALAPLPIALLEYLSNDDDGPEGRRRGARAPSPGSRAPDPDPRIPDLLTTLRRWGLRTLGDLAALPADEVAVRLGRQGVVVHQRSRGEDPGPLVPAVPEERFEQSLDLEWPIEDLEPLSFVLGRLMEPLAAHLEQRDRGAAVLHVRLQLVRKSDGTTRDVHERSLQLPFPIRDARTLRTLALLDLESHPPEAAIDRVTVAVDPTPARIVQFSLLARPLPSPEQISTLLARLQALMGETRCGSPAIVDSWQPGAFVMKPFAPLDRGSGIRDWGSGIGDRGSRDRIGSNPKTLRSPIPHPPSPAVALRRFRHPLPIRVQVKDGRPASVMTMARGVSGGGIERCAGPWRTSGHWWESGNLPIPDPRSPIPPLGTWDRDEWDVSLTSGPTYRVFRERHSGTWFIEGVVD